MSGRVIAVNAEALAFFVLGTVGGRAETREEYETIFRTSTVLLAAEELYPEAGRRPRLDFGGERLFVGDGRLAVGRARDQAAGERPRWVLIEQAADGAPRVAHLELRFTSASGDWVAAALARLARPGPTPSEGEPER